MIIRVDHWRDVEALGTWVWPRFDPKLMACPHCQRLELDGDFMDRLSVLREEIGRPLVETSGYRCPEHNAVVSSSGRDGPHTTGRAVDINIWGGDVIELTARAHRLGFTGIGWRQVGSFGKRIVHLDDLERTEGRPRPWAWTY
jgi:uncharacterized protein YcbK (DUF882 family)